MKKYNFSRKNVCNFYILKVKVCFNSLKTQMDLFINQKNIINNVGEMLGSNESARLS